VKVEYGEREKRDVDRTKVDEEEMLLLKLIPESSQ
jgi:hypothetical protein